ncbi:vesicular-fusion protein sec18 [Naviculisporaceae sp. PSN 640]
MDRFGGGRGPGLPGRPQPPSNYDSYGDYGRQPPPPRQAAGGYGGGGGGGAPYGGGGYGGGGYGNAPPQEKPRGGGRALALRLAKVEPRVQNQYIFGNISAVSPNDFPPNPDGSDLYIRLTGRELRGDYVVTARPTPGFPDGHISLSDPQRTWSGVGLMDEVVGEIYDPFAHGGGQVYLQNIDIEIGFASAKKIVDTVYDPDEVANIFVNTYMNQIFAPGQRLIMDIRNIPISILVRTVTLSDFSLDEKAGKPPSAPRSDPGARGILMKQTEVGIFKGANSPIKIKATAKRAAANAIISPDFKFGDMGIGGLDAEFSTIFRRAFASRIFPPDLIEKLGIMHVKGMLLYGPPGTGKTLIARQIGKMLNAREPKVINGPEVLNKYVGQSEENIRKLFADAEKEYKEKGDESGLHIIIFDELDAVCKQRGSGAGGGTGVGDSVVNQLLSKLDGVDQLNNILLIGMTNRKDMIDDALLRPGRLEVQLEISLPDEKGRVDILNIHTAKMKQNDVMAPDVDIAELAALTKNFSGAEISGLVKSATSYAFSRHIKVGTVAGVGEDVANMKVNHQDFLNALNEVRPAFGADESELEDALTYGIIHYSQRIEAILEDGKLFTETIKKSDKRRLMSVLLYGPRGSGKTALAAQIARDSDYPFIKMITPSALVGFRDEGSKKDYIHKVFTDAYKSPLSLLIIDDIERIIEWNPVGLRFSNNILQALLTLIQTQPPKGHRLLIFATTSQPTTLKQLDIDTTFEEQVVVPSVRDIRELGVVLDKMGAFRESREGLNGVLRRVQEASGRSEVGLGVKTILNTAVVAQSSPRPEEWFAERLAEQTAIYNA